MIAKQPSAHPIWIDAWMAAGKSLKGHAWHPGLAREEILGVQACDKWEKEHYDMFHKGHNRGICSAVCPYGLKQLKK